MSVRQVVAKNSDEVIVRSLVLGLCMLAALCGMPAWAIGIMVPRPPEAAPLEPGHTEVHVQIRDNVATTRVHQEFFNPNPRPLEADFLFPLPPGASITDFLLYVDGKPQKGEVLDREKARSIYQDIVRRMRDPGLLEWVDWNLFRVAVFPVPPRGTQKVEIEFAQPLAADQGVFKYLFPMGGPGVRRLAAATARARQREIDVVFEVTVKAERELGNVYSPTHELRKIVSEAREVKCQIEGKDPTDWQRNFILLYDYRDKEIPATLVASRHPPEPGFFCLALSPPHRELHSTTPLDLILILDTSGSMGEGNKIGQARRAIRYCLSQLTEQDRFALVRFSTEIEWYAESLVAANETELARAKEWVDRLRPAGGTNIMEALEAGSKLALGKNDSDTSSRRRRLIIFVTDGLPTVGVTAVDEILSRTQTLLQDHDVRLFTFGVGHDVNTRLLDRLAERSRGCSEYVAPEEDLEVPVARLFDKVARPALTSPEIEIKGVEAFDIYPAKLPDLFYGTQLTVLGRYKKAGPAVIRLKGMIGDERKEFVFEKTFPDEKRDAEYVERLWAARKIGFLLDELRQRGDAKELEDEIVTLSKRYGIVTPLTSMLVVEDKALEHRAQPATASGPHPRADRRGPFTGSGVRASAPSAISALRMEAGREAVAAAKSLRTLKEASVAAAAPPTDADDATIKWAAGRMFSRQGELWAEENTESQTPTIQVKAYSEAYFELLNIAPEVKEILKIGERVRFRVREVIVEVSPEGKEKLSEADRKKLTP